MHKILIQFKSHVFQKLLKRNTEIGKKYRQEIKKERRCMYSRRKGNISNILLSRNDDINRKKMGL